jgi:hypothetical protein
LDTTELDVFKIHHKLQVQGEGTHMEKSQNLLTWQSQKIIWFLSRAFVFIDLTGASMNVQQDAH